MSYILDALKKSDEKRSTQSPEAAGIHSHAPGHRSPYTTAIWLILACSSVILLIWLSRPAPELPEQPATPHPTATTAATITPPPQPWHHRRIETPVETAEQTEAAHTDNLTDQTQEPVVPVQQHQIPAPPDRSDIEPLQQIDRGTNIPERSELPASEQDKLPAIRIEGHIFDAEPDKRMVIINGQLCREKQPCGDRLILEEITEDGVILSHGGTAFHIATFD
ncbi:hypothetical protein FEF65_07695 [Mariprofundus erugo]|uniref:Type II secretion system protein GspB C-terminal domain-containing protein n=1 Tax=Mariprofundus erugo TaxID=2528639 RepID=A0A5R9GSB7_9PROT|nr:general secretion pathway protein GspB [Mariprofundus erugo]TLS67303.1 hypothetical protein FEF65_07695 [Mariprofundus erugo]